MEPELTTRKPLGDQEVVGGISPVGQMRPHPTVVQATALDHPSSFGSAGRRGLDRNPAPADPIGITGAAMAPIGR